ncbi:MAG: hypothetical protein FE78DRAFT_26813 [Acidomyces sp. 'richmondensis']|nr:MAG: hypothetical protein FE78DRAFT_26813 [Acidomyces sp. 'richmondensis']
MAFATIIARASVLAAGPDLAAPRYSNPTRQLPAQQLSQQGPALMECYIYGENSHRVRGSLDKPGSKLVGLPRSGRLETIRRILRERQMRSNVGTISIQFEDRPEDLSADEEYDRYFVAGATRDRVLPPVTDKDARVHKRQLRLPRVKTSRPGYFIPADGNPAPDDPQMSLGTPD